MIRCCLTLLSKIYCDFFEIRKITVYYLFVIVRLFHVQRARFSHALTIGKYAILLSLTVMLLIFGRVGAVEILSEQKHKLVDMLVQLNQEIGTGKLDPLANVMPPRLYKEMAARLHQKVEDLREDFTSRLSKQFDSHDLKSYHFNHDIIAYHETKTGDFYALVPTEVKMRDAIREFQTLAVYDGGSWYLIQGGQKTVQNSVFLEIYPYLAEIIIPPAKITKIDK